MDWFRFLVICRAASLQEGDVVTLRDVVSTIELSTAELPCDLQLVPAVGLFLTPEMSGKALDLMFWKLGKTGERQKLGGYAGTPLILPKSGRNSPEVLTWPPLPIVVSELGVYGFDLFDREGVFGASKKLLATYVFGVNAS